MAQKATAENMDPEQPDGPDVRGLPDIVRENNDMKKATKEKSGKQGAYAKDQCERQRLHKPAFDQICKMDRMSEDERNDFMNTFIPCFETMYPIWTGGQLDMFNGDKPGGADTEALQSNVAQLKPDAGQVEVNPPQ